MKKRIWQLGGLGLVLGLILYGLLMLGWSAFEGDAGSEATPAQGAAKPTVDPTAYTLFFPNVGLEKPSPTPAPTLTPSPAPPTSSPPPDSPLPSPAPTPRPSPTPLPPAVFKPGWGVQVHLFGEDVDQVLEWARGTGVEWVKQQVEWNNIEYDPGEYNWLELDHIVDKTNGYGFKLMLSVNHAPAWTRSDPIGAGPPHDSAEFRVFMEQLAGRYQGRVAAYELWNEPNLRREWRGEPLDPALFVDLIAAGSQGVRAADPAAQVISGAPAVTGVNDGETAIDDRIYLGGMLAAGVGEWVDGIGVHPYGYGNPPQERWDDPSHESASHNDHPSFFFRNTLEDYRRILLEGGLDLPLWVTEFGWPSVEGFGSVDVTGWEYAREISEAEQARYVVDGFHIGRGADWVGPMILWNLNIATIWGPDRPQSAYSLLRPDGDYRPAYIRLRLAEP